MEEMALIPGWPKGVLEESNKTLEKTTDKKLDKNMANYLGGLLIAMVGDPNIPLSWAAHIADEGDRVIIKGPGLSEALVCANHLSGRTNNEFCFECVLDRTSFLTAVSKHKLYINHWISVVEVRPHTFMEQFTFVSYKIPALFAEACKNIIRAMNVLPRWMLDINNNIETIAIKGETVTPPLNEAVNPSSYYCIQPEDDAVLGAIMNLCQLLEDDIIVKEMSPDVSNTVNALFLGYEMPDYAAFLAKKLIWKVLMATLKQLPEFYHGGTEDSVLALVWTSESTKCQARVVISDQCIHFFQCKRSAFESAPSSHPPPVQSFLRRKFGPIQMWTGVAGIIEYFAQNK